MATIDISTQSGAVGNGDLQLQNGAPMDSTLRFVTDALNTASPLKLSTSLVQTTSTLKITTNDNPYIDAEDGTGNNRFTIGRDSASQQVNVDFASNPTGSTTNVGAIRTYVDGTNLSEVMTFVENGNIGVGTLSTTPAGKFDIVSDGGGQFIFSRYGGQPQINIRRSQGTFAAPTAVTSGASSVLNFQNYDGTSFGTSAQIQSVPVENQTTTAKGASLALNVVQQGTTTAINGLVVSGVSSTAGSVSITTSFSSASARLSIWGTALTPTLPYFNIQETAGSKLLEFSNAGNLLVGSGSPSDTAKVSVKGSGSTSATTSLLVQNSSATQIAKFNDDGSIALGQQSNASYPYINLSGIYGGLFLNTGDSIVFRSGGTEVMRINSSLSVGIGTSTINASAILQADSTTKGFLPPRMTNAQRAAIATPAVGLMVYCTDAVEGLYIYKSTGWTFVI